MQAQELFNWLGGHGIDRYYGVPDSLLKHFCAYVTDHAGEGRHVIAANEGNAIGLAAGHFLATGTPACVYMQNSGLGNCVNPLLSLMDGEVYNIPVLLVIGWRGEPGVKDEPQHAKQGKVTGKLLDAMDIPHAVLPKEFADAESVLQSALATMEQDNKPFALMVRKGTFEPYSLQTESPAPSNLSREEAIGLVLRHIPVQEAIVATTGQISREVYEHREQSGFGHAYDFLTVGSMGHASSIALGIALEKPERTVFCLDGDGAFLMHMGASVVNASLHLPNFRHIVFNNEAHDSVGGQPTAARHADVPGLARAAGYGIAWSVSSVDELKRILPDFVKANCPAFLEIRVKPGARANLGRPKETPVANKAAFMSHLRHFGHYLPGSRQELATILAANRAQNILLFTGKQSYERMEPLVAPYLAPYTVTRFCDFSPNPKQEDIDKAVRELGHVPFDIILAIGGGSVIDFAKAYRYTTGARQKLVAMPTTFGSGSEATQFAVVYVDGVKTSLDHPGIKPDYAIVDCDFAAQSPQYLKACTAMDAFCQAIESYWAIGSTERSRSYAESAIKLCVGYLKPFVLTQERDPASMMAIAANCAGRAINESRTTAAHALSYAFTARHGIPHGHAVALTIAQIMECNMASNAEIVDPRGAVFVQGIMTRLRELIAPEPTMWLKQLFADIGLECNLAKLGISDVTNLFAEVNAQRLANNPCKIDLVRLAARC